MIPSSAMLTTPERSLITPPRAASVSGVAVTRVWEPKMAMSLTRMLTTSSAISCMGRGTFLGDHDRGGGDLLAAEPEQPADDLGRGDEGDDRRLDDRDQVARDLGLQLHEAGAVVEGAEEQCRRQDAPGIAPRQQSHGDCVEAVAGGDGRRHVVLDAERLDDARGGRQRPGEAHREHRGPSNRDPGGAGGPGVEADGPETEAERRPLDEEPDNR